MPRTPLIPVPLVVQTHKVTEETEAIVPVSGAVVKIQKRSSSSEYLPFNETGTTISSTIHTDANGNINVWVEEDSYKFIVSGGTPSIASTTYNWDAVSAQGVSAVQTGIITTADIAPEAVTSAKIGNEAIVGSKIKSSTIDGSKIIFESILDSHIGSGQIDKTKLTGGFAAEISGLVSMFSNISGYKVSVGIGGLSFPGGTNITNPSGLITLGTSYTSAYYFAQPIWNGKSALILMIENPTGNSFQVRGHNPFGNPESGQSLLFYWLALNK